MMSIKRQAMRAFTLLEVLLTLAMSVVLMGLIGTAFQFYAVDMNVRNMDIQQTQLAAAVIAPHHTEKLCLIIIMPCSYS